jgi:hypothetical protein
LREGFNLNQLLTFSLRQIQGLLTVLGGLESRRELASLYTSRIAAHGDTKAFKDYVRMLEGDDDGSS